MKSIAKSAVAGVLGWQVRRYRKKHDFKIIAVTGSIGKTTTKFAVGTVLQQKFKTRFQRGNYNDISSVPLVFFRQAMPKRLFNPLAWARIFFANERELRKAHCPYEIIVLELGTDKPGQIAQFRKYLDGVDIAIVTAITPEHMEFFADLNEVAKEELSIAKFAKETIVNADLCGEKHLKLLGIEAKTYSIDCQADYQLKNPRYDGKDHWFNIHKNGESWLGAHHSSISQLQLYSLCCAAMIADVLGIAKEKIPGGLDKVKPVPGRMNVLAGINSSTIIDDTYNASPDATLAALKTLYDFKSLQKIALLGNMNELGSHSDSAHTEIGEYCNPRDLEWVLTIGEDANKYLARAAEKRGCKVKTFSDPYSAGIFLKSIVKPNAAILAKGSQNGVFAEEAIKEILANKKDEKLLVRQSKDWLAKKRKAFK